MIDGFVWLAPLVLLPIVLLFGFVGCALETQGIQVGLPLALHYPAGLKTKAQSLEVTFTYTVQPALEEKPFDEGVIGATNFEGSAGPEARSNASLNSGEGDIGTWAADINLPDMAWITCHCNLTTSLTPADPTAMGTVHQLTSPIHVKNADENVSLFLLLDDDDDSFHIE